MNESNTLFCQTLCNASTSEWLPNFVIQTSETVQNDSRTFIDNRYFVPVVHQPWQVSKTVLFGEFLIVDFDKTNS